MHDQETPAKTAEALRGLLERLGSPDLTLAEANTLRCQVFQFLGEETWGNCGDRAVRGNYADGK
ncbi:MAG: hypothetical protein ACP5XB_07800 [Isosphaeraceae bacterium]